MKLRLRGDSLRLRLTQSEVNALRDVGSWQDATALGPAAGPRLVYRVEAAEVATPQVRFSPGLETVVTVVLPATEVAGWSDSSRVGLYFDEPWGLKVAVEKDFRCLDPNREEDESDNFDNPNAEHAHHAACQAD